MLLSLSYNKIYPGYLFRTEQLFLSNIILLKIVLSKLCLSSFFLFFILSSLPFLLPFFLSFFVSSFHIFFFYSFCLFLSEKDKINFFSLFSFFVLFLFSSLLPFLFISSIKTSLLIVIFYNCSEKKQIFHFFSFFSAYRQIS